MSMPRRAGGQGERLIRAAADRPARLCPARNQAGGSTPVLPPALRYFAAFFRRLPVMCSTVSFITVVRGRAA